MAKSSGKRHSKTVMQPVTINLEAAETEAEPPAGEEAAETAAGPAGTSAADTGAVAESADQPSGAQEEAGSGAAPESAGQTGQGSEITDRPRRGATLLAAVLGGIVAVAIAAGLQWAGWLPQRQPDLSGLQQLPGAVSAIEERVGNLERSLTDISIPASDTTALTARVNAAESAIKSLESKVAKTGTGGSEQLLQLSGRLDALQKRIDEMASAQSATGAAGTEALSERLSTLENNVSASEASAKSAREALVQQLGQLKSEVAQLSASIEKEAARPHVAGAIAAASLKSAIDRGVPFTAELDTYAAVAGDNPDTAILRKFAARGVPTQADLNRKISMIADRIIAAAQAPAKDQGIITRLIASARSLVKVRPVGEVKGDTPEAIVARMEADINAGRLDAALKEYDALPEPGKQAAGSLADDIRARQTADAILAKSISGALAPDGSSGK